MVLYWLALVLGAGGALVLRRVPFARFGAALRASRDAPARAAAIGLPVARLRLAAFTLPGAAAGLDVGGAAGVALQNQIKISPTVRVMQGTPIQVFAARDLDFGSVGE